MGLLKPFILFLRNFLAVILNPYNTYRRISFSGTDIRQVFYIYVFVLLYFLFASLLKAGYKNPFLLTFKFNSLFLASTSGFFLMIFLFYLGHKIYSTVNFYPGRLVVLWSYSLFPTLFWFFYTSVMYIVLPPPRTFSIFGKTYSLLYLVVSTTLLLWKLMLYYLTLRFALRLDLFRIILLTLLFTPVIFVYALLMYRLGVYKIPFI